ncbi:MULTISPECIES: nuclear transport factor 2 family protein [unclassified Sphingomonas]|uniref:nuclear transport factor 2 family protein n=1 Tax=unclassified Sphingomonas TaxID=196159 RepID=UPI0009261006|nr:MULTISPECIES: nuclear transport factor 2 family protein [unclassified Sphingomonas]MBN8848105.1 nuclear transport factor 2 family protein [Sphingomonas sp.]OJV31878.1 MAG: hypothetical protein BGO24_15600 [Sphingomonas sp. 67-36]
MTNPAIDIPNLLYRYADAIDSADFHRAARMFRHGCLVTGGGELRGEDAIVAMWKSWVHLYADGTPRTRHIITNPVIELSEDGQSATCRSQWTILQATDDLPLQVIAAGHYADKLAIIDGEWHYTERQYLAPELVGDMSAHLLRTIARKEA